MENLFLHSSHILAIRFLVHDHLINIKSICNLLFTVSGKSIPIAWRTGGKDGQDFKLVAG